MSVYLNCCVHSKKEIPTIIKTYDTFSVDIWCLTKAINIRALQAPLPSIKGHYPENSISLNYIGMTPNGQILIDVIFM